MKRSVVVLVFAVCVLASQVFAAESTPARSSKVLPSWATGISPRAGFDNECQGSCTVSCSSGASYYYYTSPTRCCFFAQTTCPDNSSAEGSVWWPETCGEASIC